MFRIHASIDLTNDLHSSPFRASKKLGNPRLPVNRGATGDSRPVMRRGCCAAFFAAALLLPGLSAAQANDAMLEILRSSSGSPSSGLKTQDSVSGEADSFTTRTGDVMLEADLLLPKAGAAGWRSVQPGTLASRSLAVEFFPDAYVEVIVATESRPDPNTLSINGHVLDSDLSTFSLTVTPETYLMTFSDPNGVSLYRVVGDTETGIGKVTEYDLRNRPDVIHSSPLIPPLD